MIFKQIYLKIMTFLCKKRRNLLHFSLYFQCLEYSNFIYFF